MSTDHDFTPLLRARQRVLHDLYASHQEGGKPMKDRDYIYADVIFPVVDVDGIDALLQELSKKDWKAVDRVKVALLLLGVLRRLQIAENLDKASDHVREIYATLQPLGMLEQDMAE